jgi:hypothetical protein
MIQYIMRSFQLRCPSFKRSNSHCFQSLVDLGNHIHLNLCIFHKKLFALLALEFGFMFGSQILEISQRDIAFSQENWLLEKQTSVITTTMLTAPFEWQYVLPEQIHLHDDFEWQEIRDKIVSGKSRISYLRVWFQSLHTVGFQGYSEAFALYPFTLIDDVFLFLTNLEEVEGLDGFLEILSSKVTKLYLICVETKIASEILGALVIFIRNCKKLEFVGFNGDKWDISDVLLLISQGIVLNSNVSKYGLGICQVLKTSKDCNELVNTLQNCSGLEKFELFVDQKISIGALFKMLSKKESVSSIEFTFDGEFKLEDNLQFGEV